MIGLVNQIESLEVKYIATDPNFIQDLAQRVYIQGVLSF